MNCVGSRLKLVIFQLLECYLKGEKALNKAELWETGPMNLLI